MRWCHSIISYSNNSPPPQLTIFSSAILSCLYGKQYEPRLDYTIGGRLMRVHIASIVKVVWSVFGYTMYTAGVKADDFFSRQNNICGIQV